MLKREEARNILCFLLATKCCGKCWREVFGLCVAAVMCVYA